MSSFPPVSLLPSVCVVAAALFLSSCSLFSEREVKEETPVEGEQSSMSEAEAAQQIGNPLLLNRGDPRAVNYNVSSSEELAKIDNGAEGEVYFTNPDDPDAEISGITEAFENRRHGNGWLSDYGRGVRFARRECRPVILWFHDSVTSPKSKQLGAKLLETSEFDAWCKDRVVRIKVDSGAAIDDRSGGKAKYSLQSINGMARRFGLKHRPGIVVISANGKVAEVIDGFDGMLAGVDIRIKEGVQMAEKEFDAYRKTLEERGYRTWRAARGGATLFAKLQRFDEEKNVVYLKEYGGKVTRTHIARFCKDDVDFIDETARREGASKP